MLFGFLVGFFFLLLLVPDGEQSFKEILDVGFGVLYTLRGVEGLGGGVIRRREKGAHGRE